MAGPGENLTLQLDEMTREATGEGGVGKPLPPMLTL